MKGDRIPDSDHILRYVKPTHIDFQDDERPFIDGSAFIARPREQNRPSYNWLEFLCAVIDDSIEQVRRVARIRHAATGKLVRLNVGMVRARIVAGYAGGSNIEIIHDPLDSDETYALPDHSHAVMTNVPDENSPHGELIGDLIRDCIVGMYPTRSEYPPSAPRV